MVHKVHTHISYTIYSLPPPKCFLFLFWIVKTYASGAWVLCGQYGESCCHLFLHWSFTLEVWQRFRAWLRPPFPVPCTDDLAQRPGSYSLEKVPQSSSGRISTPPWYWSTGTCGRNATIGLSTGFRRVLLVFWKWSSTSCAHGDMRVAPPRP